MRQLTLEFRHDEDTLRKYLEMKTDYSISLIVTDNSTCMLSVRNRGNSVCVRLHRIFLSADAEVLQEMADFIKTRRGSAPRIRHFIDRNSHLMRRKPPAKVTINTKGKRYDLSGIFNALNEEYFEGRTTASITWGRGCLRRAARKRTLGSYSHHNKLIRISPLLDTHKVPQYFLEHVVYHEMLHADMGVGTVGGRRSVHSREFREREKMFKHYSRAMEWEKKRWG
ncbi:MAG: SprT-like domain-containing protein [Nitrospirae bacterium]|nr:SprT-like domain-containing protein [Nitrospirota bacterium]